MQRSSLAAPDKREDVRYQPRTLVESRGVLDAFAQDETTIAWSSTRSCSTVSLQNLRTGKQTRLGYTAGTPNSDSCEADEVTIGVSGNRAVWGAFQACCNHGYGSVITAAPGSGRKTLDDLSRAYWSWGDFAVAAGSGGTLTYGVVKIEITKEIDGARGFIHCLPRDPCTWSVTGGAVKQVREANAQVIPGATPTAFLAAAASRIVVVPVDRSNRACTGRTGYGRCTEPSTRASTRVEVRNVRDGRLVTAFAAGDKVRAVAVSATRVAVLIGSGRGSIVAWYDARTGGQLGRVRAPTPPAPEIAIAGRAIVFRTGKTLHMIDMPSRKSASILALAGATPLGLSAAGRRNCFG